jgi:hypothetical protein
LIAEVTSALSPPKPGGALSAVSSRSVEKSEKSAVGRAERQLELDAKKTKEEAERQELEASLTQKSEKSAVGRAERQLELDAKKTKEEAERQELEASLTQKPEVEDRDTSLTRGINFQDRKAVDRKRGGTSF